MRLTSEDQGVLRKLGTAFHQDVDLIHETLDDAIADTIAGLEAKDRRQLHRIVERLLAKSTNAEMKGHLNRSGADLFFDAKGARMFFELALKHTTER